MLNTPPRSSMLSLIFSIAFSNAFRPSAFSGVDVVMTKMKKKNVLVKEKKQNAPILKIIHIFFVYILYTHKKDIFMVRGNLKLDCFKFYIVVIL